MKWWLRLYATRWRRRYGEEFAALIQDRGWSMATIFDVLRSILDARLHPGLAETSTALEPASASRPRRDRFDRFTQRSRTVLELSVAEAKRLKHHYVGTEHLLLGLVAEQEGIAADELRRRSFGDLSTLRREIVQPSTERKASPQPPLSKERCYGLRLLIPTQFKSGHSS